MNIKEFKQGDIITRVEPMYFTDATGGSRSDSSLIGIPVEFAGVLNGCIYVKVESIIVRLMESLGTPLSDKQKQDIPKTTYNVPFHLWQDGWEKWVDPKTILGDNKRGEKIKGIYGMMIMDEDDDNLMEDEKMYLESKLKMAEAEENYEEAAAIKKEIEKRFGKIK